LCFYSLFHIPEKTREVKEGKREIGKGREDKRKEGREDRKEDKKEGAPLSGSRQVACQTRVFSLITLLLLKLLRLSCGFS
jgi:hypothetical protein